MNAILLPLLTALVLIGALFLLIVLARRDRFAGPGIGHRTPDPLVSEQRR
jgi:hypothetical protein